MVAKKKVRESLMEQLRMKGADNDVFIDMVDSYMNLWDVSKKLEKDIKTRGVSYKEKNSSGFEITKGNQAVKDLTAVNRQMLMILKEMGLKAGGISSDEEL